MTHHRGFICSIDLSAVEPKGGDSTDRRHRSSTDVEQGESTTERGGSRPSAERPEDRLNESLEGAALVGSPSMRAWWLEYLSDWAESLDDPQDADRTEMARIAWLERAITGESELKGGDSTDLANRREVVEQGESVDNVLRREDGGSPDGGTVPVASAGSPTLADQLEQWADGYDSLGEGRVNRERASLLREAVSALRAYLEAAALAGIPLEVICGVFPDHPPPGLTEEVWRACFEGRHAVRRVLTRAYHDGEVQRIEGIAFLDGDVSCPGDGTERCEESASWLVVPVCEHDPEQALEGGEYRATLILHGTPETADG